MTFVSYVQLASKVRSLAEVQSILEFFQVKLKFASNNSALVHFSKLKKGLWQGHLWGSKP